MLGCWGRAGEERVAWREEEVRRMDRSSAGMPWPSRRGWGGPEAGQELPPVMLCEEG